MGTHIPNIPAALNDPSQSGKSDIFSKRYGDSFENAKYAPESDDTDYDFKPYYQLLRKLIHYRKKQYRNRTTNRGRPVEKVDIPDEYYHKSFSLDNPNVQEIIFPQTLGNNWVVSANFFHEKLTKYLDAIENQIAINVSKKSGNFIHALNYVSHLRDNLININNDVDTIKCNLGSYQNQCIKQHIYLLKLKIRLQNIRNLVGKLKIMSLLSQSQSTIQVLMTNNEYMGAFDLISSTRDVIHKDLNGVKSFKHLEAQLLEIENVIFRMLWADYIQYVSTYFGLLNSPDTNGLLLTQAMNQFLLNNHIDTKDDEKNNFNALNIPLFDDDILGKRISELAPIIYGMLYVKNYSFIEYFKEESCSNIDWLINHAIRQTDMPYPQDINHQSFDDIIPSFDISSLIAYFHRLYREMVPLLIKIRLLATIFLILTHNCVNITASPCPNNKVMSGLGEWLNEQILTTTMNNIHKYRTMSSDKPITPPESEIKKVISKLLTAYSNIHNYVREEFVKILQKWNLSFNPLFLTDKKFNTISSNTLKFCSTKITTINGTDTYPELFELAQMLNEEKNTELTQLFLSLSHLQSFYQSSINYITNILLPLSTMPVSSIASTQNLEEKLINGTLENSINIQENSYEECKPFKDPKNMPTNYISQLQLNDESNLSMSHLLYPQNEDGINDNMYHNSNKNPFSDDDENTKNFNEAKLVSNMKSSAENGVNGHIPLDNQSDISSNSYILHKNNNDINNVMEIKNDDLPKSNFDYESKDLAENKFLKQIQKIVFGVLEYIVQKIRHDLKCVQNKERWKPLDTINPSFIKIFQRDFTSIPATNGVDYDNGNLEIKTDNFIFQNFSYQLTNSTLHLLLILTILFHLSRHIPYARKSLFNTINHLLKTFNHNSYDALLGAGAIQTAGLKTISIKHLVILHSNLQLLSHFIPVYYNTWSSPSHSQTVHKNGIINSKSICKYSQQIIKEYQTHSEHIQMKICEIMEQNFNKYISEWEVKAPTPSPVFMVLVKQLDGLYDNLLRFLDDESTKALMESTNLTIKNLLKSKVQQLGIKNDGGPRCGVLISELLYYYKHISRFGLNTDLNDYDFLWE